MNTNSPAVPSVIVGVPVAVAAADIVADVAEATAVMVVFAGIPVPEMPLPMSSDVNAAVVDVTVVDRFVVELVAVRVGRALSLRVPAIDRPDAVACATAWPSVDATRVSHPVAEPFTAASSWMVIVGVAISSPS